MTKFLPLSALAYCLLAACGADVDDRNVSAPDGSAPEDSAAPALDCEDVAVRFAERVVVAREGRISCVSDADCVLITPVLKCPNGAELSECPVPIASDSAVSGEQALDADAQSLCSVAPADCRGAPGCVELTAACVSGACVARQDGGI